MLVLPVSGDRIDTGVAIYTVLSYAPFDDAPAVYIDEKSGNSDRILFSDIKKINGTPVKLDTAGIFTASSLVKRKFQLPQVSDIVSSKTGTVKVKSLKLRAHGKLTSGILVVGATETGAPVTMFCKEMIGIERANGDTGFKKSAFLSLYGDYLGDLDA